MNNKREGRRSRRRRRREEEERVGEGKTYTLVEVIPDAVGDRVKDHLGGKGRDEDGGQEDRVALDDGVVTSAGELVGEGAVVGLDGHGGLM